LKRHLEKKHPGKWNEIINAKLEPKDQPKVDTFFVQKPKPIEKYSVKSAKRKALNRKLIGFIAKDIRTITVVRNPGFRALMNEADPRYVLPSADTIRKKLLPKTYADAMTELQCQLDRVKYVTLTTDGWTSVATHKYNAYTVHFIDWSLQEPEIITKILECAPYDKKSTSIELEKELRRITDKYKVTSKVVLNVADNAGDIQGALNLFGAPKAGCVAHTFNLVCKNAIKKCDPIESLKKKTSKLVRTTKVSPGARRALSECCETVGIQGKTLISFVDTRWNSVYLMFQTVLDLKSALILYFVKYEIDESEALNSEDWKMIEMFTNLLKHLYTATNELCAEKHATLSKCIPMINILFHHYSPKFELEEDELAKEFRAIIYEQLTHYFQDLESKETNAISTIYDPRFKDLVFSKPSLKNQAVRLAKADAVKVAHENDESEEDIEADAEEKVPKPTNNDDFWGCFDSKIVKPNKKSKTSDYFKDCVDLEMRKYLSLPRLDRQSCPIKWWKNTGSKNFPQLFECAKKYLCMLATSVPSERVFSSAGQVINKKRARLGRQTANMLITLHTNLTDLE